MILQCSCFADCSYFVTSICVYFVALLLLLLLLFAKSNCVCVSVCLCVAFSCGDSDPIVIRDVGVCWVLVSPHPFELYETVDS